MSDLDPGFSDSGSDYEETRRAQIAKRKRRAEKGHATSDTEEEDELDDDILVDDANVNGLPTTGHRHGKKSTKSQLSDAAKPTVIDKGKGKASQKPGPPPDALREAAQDLGRSVTESANEIAQRYGKTPRDVIILAGLGVKPSRAVNPANKHAEWYAAHYAKDPQGNIYHLRWFACFNFYHYSLVDLQMYNKIIRTDYRRRTEGLDADARAAALQPILDWCESVDTPPFESGHSFKSVTSRMRSAQDKFSSLVCFPHFCPILSDNKSHNVVHRLSHIHDLKMLKLSVL